MSRNKPLTSMVHQNVFQRKIIGNSTELVKEIGRGSYGRVFLAQQTQQPRLYFVVKCISMKYANQQSINKMQANLDVLKTLWSPYIVKMYAYLRTDQHLYLYFDYCEAGTLEHYSRHKKDPLSENETLLIFRQLIEGYRAMYDMKLLHRDLKPENIMLHQGKAKISGTAFSSVIFNVDFAVFRMHNILSIYGSPELHRSRTVQGELRHDSHSNKTDIFSLGVVIFELLYGRPPYPPKKYVKAVENNEQPPVDFSKPARSKYLIDILRRMICFDQKQRMSWPDLFNHPVFSDMQKVVQLSWSCYNDMINAFNHYMTYNSVRGFFRIDVFDINESPLDPTISVTEISQRFSSCIEIYKTIMRDRNEAFFYCMIAWAYYRCEDEIPSFVNRHSEFEFVLINKAIKCVRRLINVYFNNPDTPQGLSETAWLEFKETNDYQRVRLLMYQDYTLLAKVSEAIYEKIQKSQAVSNRIAAIVEMNKKKIENEVFMKIYVDTLTEAIIELRKQKKITSPTLLLLNYMQKSFFPGHTFKGCDFDFYRFYEQEERRYGLSHLFMLKDRKNQISLKFKTTTTQTVQSVRQLSPSRVAPQLTVSKVQTQQTQVQQTGPRMQVSHVQIPMQQQMSKVSQVQMMPQGSMVQMNQSKVMLPRPISPIVKEYERSVSPPRIVYQQNNLPVQRMPVPPGMQQSHAMYAQGSAVQQQYPMPPRPPSFSPPHVQPPQQMIPPQQTAPLQYHQMAQNPARPPSFSPPHQMAPQQMAHPMSAPPQMPPNVAGYPQQPANFYVQVPAPQYYQPSVGAPQQRYRRPTSPIVKEQSESEHQPSNVHQSVVSPGAPTIFKGLMAPPQSRPTQPH